MFFGWGDLKETTAVTGRTSGSNAERSQYEGTVLINHFNDICR